MCIAQICMLCYLVQPVFSLVEYFVHLLNHSATSWPGLQGSSALFHLRNK